MIGLSLPRKEIQGDQYFRPLRHLFEHALQSRDWPTPMPTGKGFPPTRIDPEAGRNRLRTLKTLQAIDRRLGPILNTTSKYDALKRTGDFLKEKLLGLEASDCDDLHTQLLTDIRALGLTWAIPRT